jgi:hypothetical protein
LAKSLAYSSGEEGGNFLDFYLSSSPVLPDETEEDALPILMDSPQSVAFGIFIIW